MNPLATAIFELIGNSLDLALKVGMTAALWKYVFA